MKIDIGAKIILRNANKKQNNHRMFAIILDNY